MTITISVSDSFDGGNIKYITQRPNASNPDSVIDVIVRIRPDVYTELENIVHMQYFSFRVLIGGMTKKGIQKVKYVVENAHAASFPDAWKGATVCYTNDVEDVDSWRRNTNTFYTDGTLWWEQDHTSNGCVYFSYFPPYSYSRHLSFISKCAASSDESTTVLTLGQTTQGREIECVTTGTGPLVAWIIHRQHPGETMAEHYAEGLLTRLLKLNTKDDNDPIVERLKEKLTFYIVPCMCPDGAVLGHLRTNSVGANLNREWSSKMNYDAPTIERSPEVYYVLEKMKETGVDFFLDVHGDEELPYNFTCSSMHVPNWSKRLEALHGAFTAQYERVNSDMQRKVGYAPLPNPAMVLNYLNVATNQIAYRFDCLAVTLEMPFKDCRTNRDPARGWTPFRSRRLGASVLEVIEYVLPYLRDDTDFWKTKLRTDDAFVVTSNKYEEIDSDDADDGEFQMLQTRMYSDVHEIRKPKTSLAVIGER